MDKIVARAGPHGYLIYGLSASTIFYFCSLKIKEYHDIDWSVSLLMRGVASFICSYIFSCTHNADLTLRGREFKLITWRSCLMGTQQLFFFYAITIVPPKVLFIIGNIGPMFVFIISYFVLGTHLTSRDLVFLLLSLLGVNMITAP